MEQLGVKITELGFNILPYSFAIYFPFRWLEYIYNLGYTRLVKGIWHLALGITYLTNRVGIDALVMYICFIEAWDLLFQQLEINKSRKSINQKRIKNLTQV